MHHFLIWLLGNTTDDESKPNTSNSRRAHHLQHQLRRQSDQTQGSTSQASQPTSQNQVVQLTPIQMSLQQQLQSRHEELARKIIEQVAKAIYTSLGNKSYAIGSLVKIVAEIGVIFDR